MVQQIHQKINNDADYYALQVGAINQRRPLFKMAKPTLGHFARWNVPPKAKVHEFEITPDAMLPPGTPLVAAHFVPGQYVDVKGISIDKGFQGVMKRWGFKGMPASHGVSKSHRKGGSTGQRTDPGKVFKGKKMAGQMGGRYATSFNCKVMKIDNHFQLLYIKGTIAGYAGTACWVMDARKKHFGKAFPQDALPPPFPTIDSEIAKTMPRELVAKTGGTDPFVVKDE